MISRVGKTGQEKATRTRSTPSRLPPYCPPPTTISRGISGAFSGQIFAGFGPPSATPGLNTCTHVCMFLSMSVNESFLATALASGKIRPTPGHLWCEKLASVSSVDVDGLGSVSVSEVTSSGLVLVSDRTEEADTVLGNLLVVRAVGEDPHLPRGWHTYHLGREVSWPLGTWEGQRIEVGTVIAIRAVAGVNQGRDRRYVQVRYDEIAAIGAPLDEPEDAPAMYPGPGWVLVRLDAPKDDTFGSVYVGEGRRDVFENGGVHWGTVYSLPRGFSEPSLGVSIGSRVAVPRWQSTEYLELEGGIRAVPWGDVLAVEE